jgi:hypothetical protein
MKAGYVTFIFLLAINTTLNLSLIFAAEFVLQLIKMSSNQYRSCTTERNGQGGSGTHDLSQPIT